MSANPSAISRRLMEKGFSQDNADAVAEEIVSHADETRAMKGDMAATKLDIIRLEGKIEALTARVDMLVILVAGLYIPLVAMFISSLTG